jgi:hypothetical protein
MEDSTLYFVLLQIKQKYYKKKPLCASYNNCNKKQLPSYL